MLATVSVPITRGHPLTFCIVSSAERSPVSVFRCATSARRRASLSAAVESEMMANATKRTTSPMPKRHNTRTGSTKK